MEIAIGICARNEESCIIQTLDSIVTSAFRVSTLSHWPIFICTNGCTDGTVDLVKSWIDRNPKVVSFLINLERANLVEGQREISNKAKSLGINTIIFFDADLVVDPECISELLTVSQSNTVKAAYAVSIPVENKNKTLVERALNQYDLSPTAFTERKHLHGRAFLIKDWDIPETNPKLLADDIYLSFFLLKKYGIDSIVRVPQAKVYFNQVKTFTDFYNAYRRRRIEVEKCLTLFPEFQILPPEQVNRKFLWNKAVVESMGRIFLWLVLLLLRMISKIRFNRERHGKEEWVQTFTSKQTGVKPILILIEGLDCSGKKTIARNLRAKFLNAGISCTINKGPLNSKIYRAISHLVSLYPFPNFIRSIVYSFEGVGERSWERFFAVAVVIQISSPYRNWAYAYLNKSFLRMFVIKLIKNKIAHYDLVYYLSVPYFVRLERHKFQVASKENSDYINKRFPGEEKFKKMEELLKGFFAKSNPIDAEFDTSKENASHITESVFNAYLARSVK